MAKKSKYKPLPGHKTEDELDAWFEKVDLTQHFSGDEFYRMRFSKLEKKLIDESYEQALKSQPVTLRLPQELIQKLKLAAIKQGIAYQTLARLLLQKSVARLL